MESRSHCLQKKYNTPIAVIGMGCIFPKSSNLKEYYRLLFRGVDAIEDVPETHWSPNDYYDRNPKTPDHIYCTRGGFVSAVPFDPTEFGIPPSILEATDTSQLLSLIVAKMALEDAGYGDDRQFTRDRTSVILGVTGTQELVIPLGARLGYPKWRKALAEAGVSPDTAEDVIRRISDAYVPWQENSFPGLLGNVVAGRICNRLDLGGTNCVVDAACASSMSALHLGVMELAAEHSDMVVSGGVDLLNDIFMHMCFSRTMILSPTQDIRPFSKEADGTVLGEGVGMVVLKRLADAEKDGDPIYAVLKSLGSSSDGKSQSIYAPRVDGQLQALRSAYTSAGVEPDTVELIEAHGTGTRVGDMVEFNALKKLFGEFRKNGQKIALGSVKSMIGHTKAAAGAAGLIKTVLSLYHKFIPPTLKADIADPNLDIDNSSFYLSKYTRPWFSRKDHPRRAGVSSFGFGGSNFHVVLEEYAKEKKDTAWEGSVEIFALSASTPRRLIDSLDTLKKTISEANSDYHVSIQAAKSRSTFSYQDPHRLLFVFNSLSGESQNITDIIDQARHTFETREKTDFFTAQNLFYGYGDRPGKLAFVFPGQGSQYVNMGRDLICCFPEAFNTVETANEVFERFVDSELNYRLSDFVYPESFFTEPEKKKQENLLKRTDIAQPAIGAISCAYQRILERFGLRPEATCGHSFGELSALHAAGWIDTESLFHLSVCRGRYMAEVNCGTMLAVKGPLDDIACIAKDAEPDVILANLNTYEQGVLSGTEEAIARADHICRQRGFRTIKLAVSGAFHTHIFENARNLFSKTLQTIHMASTKIPVFSNKTANSYPADSHLAKKILGDQLTSPVDFVNEIKNLFSSGIQTFVEVGPKSVLTGLIKSILKGSHFHALSMDGSAGKRFGILDLALTLCHLGSLGYPIDLNQWESPPKKNREPKMNIPLCGANYRQKKESPHKENIIPIKEKKRIVDKNPTMKTPQPAAAPPVQRIEERPSVRNIHSGRKTMEKPNPRFVHSYKNLLDVVQEGMKTMQSLSTQTAETHTRFLETQAEASRTLQKMMDDVRHFAENTSDVNIPQSSGDIKLPRVVSGAQSSPEKPTPQPSPAPPDTKIPDRREENVTEIKSVVKAESKPGSPSSPADPPPRSRNKEIESALLDIVSRLTGYPKEMVAVDMDIEGDLGIDSIKRVEILSALEEKMPGMPTISPDMMGTLRTIGQITDFLATASPDAVLNASPADPPPDSGAPETSHRRDDIVASMIDIVSHLTGYPAEMLSLEMDIESDLGIDSIKRVEILSTMEERMPGLPTISPDEMGTLKTLGQIAEYLAASHTASSFSTPASPMDTCSNTAASPTETNADRGRLETALIGIVSRLTGYPEEMLALDMDIESDLGIDSIKRVEILSALEEEIPGLPAVAPDEMGTLRTLRKIVDYLSRRNGQSAGNHSTRNDSSSVVAPPAAQATVERKIVRWVKAPDTEDVIVLSPAGIILIVDDGTDFSASLATAIQSMGYKTRLVSLSEPPDDAVVSGLVIPARADAADSAYIKEIFSFTQHIAPKLHAAAQEGTAVFAAITQMDGQFGFNGKRDFNPYQGALAGLVKTADIEWKDVFCRIVDIEPGYTPIDAIAAELFKPGAVEIGISASGRWSPVLEDAAYPNGNPEIQPDDVILITGGARGVTAQAALALAKTVRPRLILIGRSEPPANEPEWLRGLTEAAAVKRAILENEFAGTTVSPKTLEKTYRRWTANRDIGHNIRKIESAGSSVHYYSADVRDANALKTIVEDVRRNFGPVRGVIHGAGVLEDRLIIDKTPEQFDNVFDTKVEGLRSLLDATHNEPLKYIVLFSSVSARMGNKGQSDYAMANEVLNKMAQREAVKRSECKVVSINWGPWDGGMVSESLKREFLKNDVGLIPLDQGADCLVKEMGGDETQPVEVVIGANIVPFSSTKNFKTQKPGQPLPQRNPFTFTVNREIDIEHHPILESHILGGNPVVPFALIAEWLGHGALHGNPGLYLYGLDNFRLFSGIKLNRKKKTIRLMAGKALKKGPVYEVDVEIRNGCKDGADLIHSSAKAILTDRPGSPPVFNGLVNDNAKYPRSIDEVYEKILFHGDHLRGIREIVSLSSEKMTAHLSCAPSPQQWMREPLRSKWIGDPLILDSAFQMAIVWCYEHKGMVSLPSYTASYRQYCRAFPKEGVIAILNVKDSESRKMMKGDFTFIDDQNRVVAELIGFEAVMDQSLLEAFHSA